MKNYQTLLIDIDVYEKLKRQADKTGQSINELLKGMTDVVDYLDKIEEELKGSGFYD